MKLSIESERDADGRWLAEVPELPGVMAYGANRNEALAKAQVLALRVLAERQSTPVFDQKIYSACQPPNK